MSSHSVLLPRRVYTAAAVLGIAVLAPMYFLEKRIGADLPPAITHPEHFYGFIGLALVWQFAFLVIARDPVRFRPLMPITVLEKLSFGLPVVILFLLGRVAAPVLTMGIVDLSLGVAFLVAYLRTPTE